MKYDFAKEQRLENGSVEPMGGGLFSLKVTKKALQIETPNPVRHFLNRALSPMMKHFRFVRTENLPARIEGSTAVLGIFIKQEISLIEAADLF